MVFCLLSISDKTSEITKNWNGGQNGRKPKFLLSLESVSDYLNELLQKEIIAKFPKLVKGIRGKGLMLGLEAKEKNEILQLCGYNDRLQSSRR